MSNDAILTRFKSDIYKGLICPFESVSIEYLPSIQGHKMFSKIFQPNKWRKKSFVWLKKAKSVSAIICVLHIEIIRWMRSSWLKAHLMLAIQPLAQHLCDMAHSTRSIAQLDYAFTKLWSVNHSLWRKPIALVRRLPL